MSNLKYCTLSKPKKGRHCLIRDDNSGVGEEEMRSRSLVIEDVSQSSNVSQTNFDGWSSTLRACKTYINSAGSYTWLERYNYKTMDDELVPHFKRRQSSGELFFNPMSSSQVILKRNSGTVSWSIYKIDGYGCKYGGATGSGIFPFTSSPLSLGSGYEPTDIDVSSEKNRLLIEAYSRAYINDMMLLATLGEFEETIVSIAQTIRVAADILKAFTTKRFMSYLMSRRTKDIANIWMHYRYALRPLYFDIIGALKAFKSLDKVNQTKRQTFRAFCNYGTDRVTDIQSFDYARKFTTTYTVTKDLEIRTGLLADILISWDTIFGLDRLAGSAWELVPMSFIIDWFVNIGQLISAFEPTAKRRVLGNWATVTSVTRYRAKRSAVLINGYSGYYDSTRLLERDNYARTRFVNLNCELDVSKNVKLTLAKTLDLGIILKQLLDIKKLT